MHPWSRSMSMKNALIIGATGGIGAAVHAELVRRGITVTGLARRDGLDVTNPASVEHVLGGLTGSFDLIFIAIGTLAAGGAPEKSLAAIEANQMARVIATNTIGPALILRHCERLLPRDGRSVVGVLSARVGSIGDNKIGGWHSYRASKAALNQIVHGAAIEIGRKRRDAVIVALHPGTVATSFTQGYPTHNSQTGGFFDYAGDVVPW